MPQGPPARTVGARLREAREKRGVSLRQISNSTRISVMSLEALERSDLSRLPGGIFTRAFIRAYAQEVGLDPDRTIQDFIAEQPPETMATSRAARVEDGEKLDSDRKAVATAVRLILVSLPIIGFVIYYGTYRAPQASLREPSSIAERPVASGGPSTPAGATAAAEVPVPTASHGDAASVPQSTALVLEIAPRASCWVAVTVDGERAYSGLMGAGEKRRFTAREQILINVGDAAAFAYTLNGRIGRPLGAPGEVVSKRITLSNLSEFAIP